MLSFILGIIVGILLAIVAILSSKLGTLFNKIKNNTGDQEAHIVQMKDPLDELGI